MTSDGKRGQASLCECWGKGRAGGDKDGELGIVEPSCAHLALDFSIDGGPLCEPYMIQRSRQHILTVHPQSIHSVSLVPHFVIQKWIKFIFHFKILLTVPHIDQI